MLRTTRWWWIRHAPVTEDGGCVYGQADVPSNCSETAAFEGLAAALPREAVWITTHLRRTTETAAAIGAAGLPLPGHRVERDFAEQHFGEWQGQNRDALFARMSEWHRFWLAPATSVPPGGESFVQLVERVAGAIGRHTAEHAGRDIVSVAHGGTIRAALSVALGIEPAASLAFAVENLSITRLDHIEGAGPDGDQRAWRVVTVNRPPLAAGLRIRGATA